MEGMTAYQCYMSLKLHFTTDDYDYFKYQGRTRQISESKLQARKDYFHFRKIERRYKDELQDFIVANFVSNPNMKWAGDLSTLEADRTFKEWKKRKESLKYFIKQELSNLSDDPKTLWNVVNHGHPKFLQHYLGKRISLETLIATNEVINFLPHWFKEIQDDFVWKDISRLIVKYKPFVRVDKSEIKQIMKEVLL